MVDEGGAAAMLSLVLQAADPRPLPPPCRDSSHNPLGSHGRTHATVWGTEGRVMTFDLSGPDLSTLGFLNSVAYQRFFGGLSVSATVLR